MMRLRKHSTLGIRPTTAFGAESVPQHTIFRQEYSKHMLLAALDPTHDEQQEDCSGKLGFTPRL